MSREISIDEFNKVTEKGKSYFYFHKDRYEYCLPKIFQKASGKNVIDVGSKYLFQACFLSRWGLNVHAYDAKKVVNKSWIKNRAKRNGIKLKAMGDLSEGKVALDERDNKYDVLIMSEVIEHLAFNHLKMWRSLIRVLKPGGRIFISTPNSVSLEKRLIEVLRVLSGIGRGVNVESVLETPTYGHHWKEYSIKEVYRYFNKLGFKSEMIDVWAYNYRPYLDFANIQSVARNVSRYIGNKFESLSDEMLVMVKIPSNKPVIESPDSYV